MARSVLKPLNNPLVLVYFMAMKPCIRAAFGSRAISQVCRGRANCFAAFESRRSQFPSWPHAHRWQAPVALSERFLRSDLTRDCKFRECPAGLSPTRPNRLSAPRCAFGCPKLRGAQVVFLAEGCFEVSLPGLAGKTGHVPGGKARAVDVCRQRSSKTKQN